MDVKNLETFVMVNELKSFTLAAGRLGYTQSTVSFQIKQLEKELSIPLFERIGHTVTLTNEGEKLLPLAQQILRLAAEASHISGNTAPEGLVRIAIAESLASWEFHSRFKDFHEKYPGIRLKIIATSTDEMFQMLGQNQVDIVYTLDRHIYHSDYVIVTESREAVHFVTGYQNSLNGKKQIPLQELICQPFILTEKEMSYRRMLSEYLASCSLEIQPVFEVGNTELICRMLEKNASAISLLPDYVTEKAVQEKRLVRLDVKDFQLDIWKQLLYHRDKWISPQMQAFMNVIKEVQA